MKRKVLLVVLVMLVILVALEISTFAYYDFLSDDSNVGLNKLKEKYSIEQKHWEEHWEASENEKGFIWALIGPACDSKEISEHTEIIEGNKYTITEIVIVNPQGPMRVIWGSAAKFHPYDVPRITVIHQ